MEAQSSRDAQGRRDEGFEESSQNGSDGAVESLRSMWEWLLGATKDGVFASSRAYAEVAGFLKHIAPDGDRVFGHFVSGHHDLLLVVRRTRILTDFIVYTNYTHAAGRRCRI